MTERDIRATDRLEAYLRDYGIFDSVHRVDGTTLACQVALTDGDGTDEIVIRARVEAQ